MAADRPRGLKSSADARSAAAVAGGGDGAHAMGHARFRAVVFFAEARFDEARLRPEPDFLPPPVCLLTVAQARRSASFFEVPVRS